MDQVADGGAAALQVVGAGQAPLRMLGGLDGVDPQVVGEGVVGVLGQDAPQDLQDLRRPRLGAAVRLPVVSGVEHHQGFGVEGRGVFVLGKVAGDPPHGFGVRAVQLPAFGGLGAVRRKIRLC